MLAKTVTVVKSTARWTLSLPASPWAAHLIGEPLFRLMGLRDRGRELCLSKVKRVLVVRLDEIGDVIMTTPFLHELRQNLPKTWITLLVKPEIYNLVELCPSVNEVLVYNWRAHRYLVSFIRQWRALRLARKSLWQRHFDLCILPRWDVDGYHATFLAYFSGARWRVGYSEIVSDCKQRHSNGLDCLLTHVLHGNTVKHEVEHNLDVIRFLGGTVREECLELWLSPEDEAFAKQVLSLHGVKDDSVLVSFGPGAGAPKRMWPLSNFVELGAWLKQEVNAHLVVVGGEGEEPLGQELQRQLGDRVINLVGQTTLRQTGALLKRCYLYVGNDAGPMHLAAAAGIPVIEISCHPLGGSPLHANSPRRFGPWRVPHRVLQPETAVDPCVDACTAARAHCILGVAPERAIEAIAAQLSRQRGCVSLKEV